MSAPDFMDWERFEKRLASASNALGQSIFLDLRYTKRYHQAVQCYEMIVNMQSTTQDVLRVSINPDGTFDIVDFTLPSSGERLQTNVPQEDVSKWVMEAVSMLRITNEGEYVREVGFKINDSLYYINEKRGEE
jgi:hypothetical protein